jgi:hypothetical protein
VGEEDVVVVPYEVRVASYVVAEVHGSPYQL